MEEQTTTVTKPTDTTKPMPPESHAFGITIRGWLAIMVFVTVCIMSILGRPIVEPLYTIAAMVAGIYFAQQSKPQMPPK